MATDKISVSFCNSDDEKFWKEESSNIKEENSMHDTKSLNGESSSCSLSKKEIELCLDSQHIKDNFTDIKKIGAGGFGSVYEAVHTIENRKYALKFVKNFSLDFDKNEVKILASLKHPNVLRYYTSWITPLNEWNSCSKGSGFKNSDSIVSFEKDITPSENNIAVVSTDAKSRNDKTSETDCGACLVIQTELCSPNKNLKILIDEELFRMSEKNRRNLFLDIVSGLQYIHKKGIMHRDLKPPNILIDKDKRAIIGDFGIARKCKISPADDTLENGFSQNVGTYPYVAPEVKNSTVYDIKADIYSLGMILFEMYHKMGSGMERIKTMENLRNQDFSDLKNIPARFENIRRLIKSLLNHDPSLRRTLKGIIKIISPLEEQQSVEKNKFKAEEEKFLLNMEYSRLQRTMDMIRQTKKCFEMLRVVMTCACIITFLRL